MDENTLLYAESHEWVHIDGETAVVGLSKFAVDELTDIVFIELPKVGATLRAGQPFGSVESVKSVGDLNSPVAGEVIEVNSQLEADPGILNQDPYTVGWMIKLKLSGAPDTSGLLDKAAYDAKTQH